MIFKSVFEQEDIWGEAEGEKDEGFMRYLTPGKDIT